MKADRKLIALACALIIISLFTACDNTKKEINVPTAHPTTPTPGVKTTPTQSRADIKGELKIWHISDEEALKMAAAFKEAYPNVEIDLSVIESGTTNVYGIVVKSDSGVPDVIAIESAHMKRLINAPDSFIDLTEKSKYYIENMIPYTVDMGTDEDGKIKALAYKKPLAKKYLGTDDSEKISEMLSTQEKMLETAKVLKEKSKGKVALFPTFEEPLKLYLGGRSQGWIVNNKLNIDQKMIDFIDFAKTLRKNKYEASLFQWSPQWHDAIADDEKAFAWLCPVWGIPWIIAYNDKKAAEGGRWGLAKPPFPYFWGGTWLAIPKNSTKQDLAWEFIKFFTTDKDALKIWSAQNQDLPNNLQIISEGSPQESEIMGTDILKFYEPFIKDINGKIITMYDDTIEITYVDAVRSYLAGNIKSKEEVLTTFKDTLKTRFKDSGIDIK